MERNIWNAGDRSLSFLFRSTPERKETEDVVRKVRNTRSQKKLNAAKRRQNLKNAYQVTADITGLSVLVVDDVYTTGSTMDAMAQCLLEAGAKEVYFLTVCAGRA